MTSGPGGGIFTGEHVPKLEGRKKTFADKTLGGQHSRREVAK